MVDSGWEGSDNSFARVWPETGKGRKREEEGTAAESRVFNSDSPFVCSVLLSPFVSLASFLLSPNALHLTLTLHPSIQPKQCKWNGGGLV